MIHMIGPNFTMLGTYLAPVITILQSRLKCQRPHVSAQATPAKAEGPVFRAILNSPPHASVCAGLRAADSRIKGLCFLHSAKLTLRLRRPPHKPTIREGPTVSFPTYLEEGRSRSPEENLQRTEQDHLTRPTSPISFHMRVSKNWAPYFGDLDMRDPIVFGSILGALIFGNSHICAASQDFEDCAFWARGEGFAIRISV